MSVSWKGLAALTSALLVFLATAEYVRRGRPGPKEPLAQHTLAFDDLTARVRLPTWGAPKNYPGETNQFRFVFSERLAKDIMLRRKGFGFAEGRRSRQQLDNGFTLEYAVGTMNGGSGGAISSLTGTLKRGALELGVKCFDQGEGGEPDASWCIKYLHTLTVGP